MAEHVPAASVASDGGFVKLECGGDGKVWTLFVSKLSVVREQSLLNELARRTKKAMGPGGYFANAKPALDWLREAKMNAEWQVAVEKLTTMEGLSIKPSADAIDDYRMSKEGVALELFYRTRKAHEEIKLNELEAIITDVNALETHIAILEAITDDKKST